MKKDNKASSTNMCTQTPNKEKTENISCSSVTEDNCPVQSYLSFTVSTDDTDILLLELLNLTWTNNVGSNSQKPKPTACKF